MDNPKSKGKKRSLNKKGNFEKRLLSYSLVAGTIAIVPELKAEIHYTNIDPDSVCIDSLLLDFDGDAEIEIVAVNGSGNTNFIYAGEVNKASIMGSESSTFSSSSIIAANALEKGDTISAQKTFDSYGYLGIRTFSTTSTSTSSSTYTNGRILGGKWPQNEERYLGFRFEKMVDSTTVDTLYGWLRLKLDSTFSHFSAYDFAYEDISGKAIIAGDTGDVATDLTLKDDLIPKEFNLHQNYPNPFNPSTKIAFDLPKSEKIVLNVYNISGELIATLKNASMPAGKHEFIWNGKNKNGQDVASGMYIYELKAGNVICSKKMLLVR